MQVAGVCRPAVFGDDGGDFPDHIATKSAFASRQTVTDRQTLSFLRHNRAIQSLCGASFVGVIGSAIGGKSIVYYINYYAPDDSRQRVWMTSIGILGAVSRHLRFRDTGQQGGLSKRWVWVE